MTFELFFKFVFLTLVLYWLVTFLFDFTGMIKIRTNENQLVRGVLSMLLSIIILWGTS